MIESPLKLCSQSSLASNLQPLASSCSILNLFIFNTDITFEIFLYLRAEDILNSQISCQFLYSALSLIWRLLIWRDIVPIQFKDEVLTVEFRTMGEERFFHHIAEILSCKTDSNIYLEIYKVLYRFRYPLLGYYRRLPASLRDYRGALDLINVSSNRLVYQSYSFSVDHITSTESISWKASRSKLLNEDCPCILSVLTSASLPCPALSSPSMLIQQAFQITFHSDSHYTRHRKLFPPMNPSSTLEMMTKDQISLYASCLGLVKGMYGPHGMELLHTYLHEPVNNEEFGDTTSIGHTWQLHGFKIIGDPNVPANQLSFCINLSNEFSVHNSVQEDTRVCLSFGADHVPAFFELSSRLPHILCWRRGLGQINRTPFTWDPEWRMVNFVVYDPMRPLISNDGLPILFSVLFDDHRDSYRHVIDYKTVSYPTGGQDCHWI